mgnify:CR=1 FL=1
MEGDRHIVASGATGAWAGHANAVAVREDGAWRFLNPKLGWCAWSDADGVLLVYDGAAWTEVTSSGAMSGTVTQLGVNESAVTAMTVRLMGQGLLQREPGAAAGLVERAVAGLGGQQDGARAQQRAELDAQLGLRREAVEVQRGFAVLAMVVVALVLRPVIGVVLTRF